MTLQGYCKTKFARLDVDGNNRPAIEQANSGSMEAQSLSSTSTSDEDDSQVDNTVVIRSRPDDRRPATVRVELQRRVTWPTRASVWKWELRVVAEARYTIITMDTNVATLILDGKASGASSGIPWPPCQRWQQPLLWR